VKFGITLSNRGILLRLATVPKLLALAGARKSVHNSIAYGSAIHSS